MDKSGSDAPPPSVVVVVVPSSTFAAGARVVVVSPTAVVVVSLPLVVVVSPTAVVVTSPAVVVVSAGAVVSLVGGGSGRVVDVVVVDSRMIGRATVVAQSSSGASGSTANRHLRAQLSTEVVPSASAAIGAAGAPPSVGVVTVNVMDSSDPKGFYYTADRGGFGASVRHRDRRTAHAGERGIHDRLWKGVRQAGV